ncbi:MAG: TlyA family RNA methyltransferase [Clostridia bacterium]|nr:TlyA family RNA methyltransferase [Clostridia bacterium]
MADFRLDMYIREKLNISRQKAQELIQNNGVTVNGKIINKPSHKVSYSDEVVVNNTEKVLKYVGRGGYKLEKAVDIFNINIKGVCVDIGASTGGFTDCMLQNGAEVVYAVDVGSNQLAEKLRNDKRVISMENTDIRNAVIPKADFIGCDVSFISLTKIFPSVCNVLNDRGCGVFLIKPQFEAGKENISKNGIVKNPKVHKKVIRDIIGNAGEEGLYIKAITYSPIQGGDGNIEYLVYIDKTDSINIKQSDIDRVVESAFDAFKSR